jgi:hypothetical protein
MRNGDMAVALAMALAAIPAGAGAQQIQGQEATVAAGTIGAPAGPGLPFAAAAVRTYTYQPVCEVRRVQFSDEYGWRVRDVRICY